MHKLTEYPIHPAADLFPMMESEAFEGLKKDIDENGVRDCITLFEGKIIDGRNRYKAMLELGIDPACHAGELEECDDPVTYVLSLNLHRRHLSEAQRSMVAAKIANMKRGDNQHAKEDGAIAPCSQETAAKMLNVSRDSVKRAKKVIDNAAPEVVELVTAGELPVSVAAKFVELVDDKNDQATVAKAGAKAVRQKTITGKVLKSSQEPNRFGEFCIWWERLSAQERRTVRPLIIGHIDGD